MSKVREEEEVVEGDDGEGIPNLVCPKWFTHFLKVMQSVTFTLVTTHIEVTPLSVCVGLQERPNP